MTPFHTACLNQQAKIAYFLMESEDKYGINLSLLDQNGFSGFGYLTKEIDLKNETKSPHTNFTQKDIEKGQEANQRYSYTNLSYLSFRIGKILTYLKFAFKLTMTTLTVMILMIVDTFSDYNMAYKHFR